MKLKELKHNHSLTDLLKILIFSLLMLAPILSVATRCLYVVCNKNAYQSYYGETTNEIEIKELNDLQNYDLNTKYYLNNIAYSGEEATSGNIVYFTGISWGTYNYTNAYAVFFAYANNPNLYMNILNGVSNVVINNLVIEIQINGLDVKNNFYNNLSKKFTYEEPIAYSYLDNVFEYSVHSLEDNQLFNWTENTAVYTGVNAMTSNLEIEGNVIPILITYWFLLTIIYVIIDIVLKLFTILTHMIGNKTT